MSKKIIIVLIIFAMLFGLGACGSKKSDIAMSDFETAFKDQGINIKEGDKPFFQMISATDGVMFESEDKIVIYEYKSVDDLNKAKDDYEIIKDWNTNGRFLIETSNEKAVEIFISVD